MEIYSNNNGLGDINQFSQFKAQFGQIGNYATTNRITRQDCGGPGQIHQPQFSLKRLIWIADMGKV